MPSHRPSLQAHEDWHKIEDLSACKASFCCYHKRMATFNLKDTRMSRDFRLNEKIAMYSGGDPILEWHLNGIINLCLQHGNVTSIAFPKESLRLRYLASWPDPYNLSFVFLLVPNL